MTERQEAPQECQHVKDLLYLYLSGETEPRETEEVEGHLEACEDCRQALKEHAALEGALFSAWLEKSASEASQPS